MHIRFHCRVSAGMQDLPGIDCNNFRIRHKCALRSEWKTAIIKHRIRVPSRAERMLVRIFANLWHSIPSVALFTIYVLGFFRDCPVFMGVLWLQLMAADSTDTLKPGDLAPKFSLQAANAGETSLDAVLAKGPVIVEFLRGTW